MQPSSSPLVSTVLIVDDSESDRYVLRRLLKKAGIAPEIFEQHNGKAALEFLDQEGVTGSGGPLLIFLDINMPVMDGFEFLKEFEERRRSGELGAAVLVMFTSSSNPADQEKVAVYEFVKGYIVKMPESAEQLRDQVTELLATS